MLVSPNDPDKVLIFDTTLRDGGQTRDVNFSVLQKIIVSLWLDAFGVAYIEGGWPDANPTDTAFFRNLPTLQQARFVSFGMTRRRGKTPETDDLFLKVVNSAAPVVCLFGKTCDLHIPDALKVTPKVNLDMIYDSVAYVKNLPNPKEMVFDAEHFFDGYRSNKEYAIECLLRAKNAGADWLVLCDTNGGTVPGEMYRIVSEVTAHPDLRGARFGIHCHNDKGFADANTVLAVEAGCRMVQGTLNGLGERCGNANLINVIPSLVFDYGLNVGIPRQSLASLTHLSREFDKLLRRAPNKHAPYVGKAAFFHKGGVHASVMDLYEHMNPALVGNKRTTAATDQSGLSNIRALLKDLGIEFDDKDPRLGDLLNEVKELKRQGYIYEDALASFAVLAMKTLHPSVPLLDIVEFEATVKGYRNQNNELVSNSNASVILQVGENQVEIFEKAKGKGVVHALDRAMRKALKGHYPELEKVRLDDYHVTILKPDQATGAPTHVLIDMKDEATGAVWTTVGIDTDIVKASLKAIVDGYNYRLTVEISAGPETPKELNKYALLRRNAELELKAA